jgi:hypothetical protein
LLAATACTVTEDDELAPGFPPGLGQLEAAPSGLPYAAGPFGFGKGSVLPNYGFVGYVDPAAQIAAAAPRQIIWLAEFYNPTGFEVYGAGSVFPAGTPKPLALLIDMSARW